MISQLHILKTYSDNDGSWITTGCCGELVVDSGTGMSHLPIEFMVSESAATEEDEKGTR